MKTPFDDAIARLVDLAREGFSRGWDRLDRADKHDAIADAICGVHAEWFALVSERDRLRELLSEACKLGDRALRDLRHHDRNASWRLAHDRLATIRTEALK